MPPLLQSPTTHPTLKFSMETAAKPTHSSSVDGDKQKPFDREVRDMVNAITSRVGGLPKSHHHHHQQAEEEDEHGIRIITLAGTNTGATMRSELDDKLANNNLEKEDDDPLGTYVNSNFQAVNNSIMLGSTYNTNDPGVHLDISDFFEHHHPHKLAKKGKKKDKEAAVKSDQHTTGRSD